MRFSSGLNLREYPPPEGAGTGLRAGPAPSGPRGFMLLEVLVAIVILGIAVVLVMQLLCADLRATAGSLRYFDAVISAESRLMELAGSDQLTENTWTERDAAGRRVVVSVREALQDRTEGLVVKLLEISLDIYWISGGREKSISLKTMKAVKKPEFEQEQIPWDDPVQVGLYGDA